MILKHDKKMIIIRLIAIVLCLFFITSKFISKTLAKYTSSDFGSDSARVATFFVGDNGSASIGNFSLEEIYNGATKEIEFVIVNFEGEKITEVAYNYEFTVSTLNNLPLIITIETKQKTGSGEFADIDNITGHATSGLMDCNSKSTHSYVIKIKWNEEVIDYEYTELIDILTIDYTCSQID